MQINKFFVIINVFLLLLGNSVSAEASKRLASNLGLGGGNFSWSPDGKKIAYTSTQGSPHGMITNIWVMNASGTGKRRLTSPKTWDNYPDWSPDGTKILYSSRSSPSEPYQLWTIDRYGGNKKRITFDKNNYISARWSPDGKQILYTSGKNRIWKMDADGYNQKQLTFRKSQSPSWTRDGRILYSVYTATGKYDIFLADAEGKTHISLLGTSLYELSPEISPDGLQIVYESWNTKQNTKRIAIMNANGKGSRNLTKSGIDEGSPRWSPSGKEIAYNTWMNDKNELRVMSVTQPVSKSKLPEMLKAPEKKNEPKPKPEPTHTKGTERDKIFEDPSSNKKSIIDTTYQVADIFTCTSYNPGRKRAFNQKKKFHPGDEKVWVLVNFIELKKSCVLKLDFYSPEDELYYSTETKSIPPTTDKELSFGTFMSIKGSPAEKMAGKWSVKMSITFENGSHYAPLLVQNREDWHLYFHIEY